MHEGEHSISSDTLTSDAEDTHLDSASNESSVHNEKQPTTFFNKASSHLQHTIFLEIQKSSRQSLEDGNIEQALIGYERCTEQLLTILKGDVDSPEFQDYLYKTLNYLNDVALKFLKANLIDNALQILNKCLDIAHPEPYRVHPDLQSLTYNHLGCCYRRLGDLEQALYYLRKALQYHERAIQDGVQGKNMESSSITHVNLCAVLSQKGNHKKALEHARKAVVDCTRDMINSTKNVSVSLRADTQRKKGSMLAIAYFNLAVEEDFCKNSQEAVNAYQRAYKLAEEHNGPEDVMTTRFQSAYHDAKSKRRSPPLIRSPSSTKMGSPLSSHKFFNNTQSSRLDSQTSQNYSQSHRPHSAHQFAKKESATSQLEAIVSPKERYIKNRNKLSITNAVGLLSESGNITATATFNRIPHSASTIVSHRETREKFTRPVTTKADPSTKFFFPMANRAPLIDPDLNYKTGNKDIKKPQRPNLLQRPKTATVSSARGVHDYRMIKPSSPTSLFQRTEKSQEDMFILSSERGWKDDLGDSDYFQIAKQDFPFSRTESANTFSTKKPFIVNPKRIDPNNKRSARANENNKFSSIGFDSIDDPFSFRRPGGIPSLSDTRLDSVRPWPLLQSQTQLQPLYQYNAEEEEQTKRTTAFAQKAWRGYLVRRQLRKQGFRLTRRRFWTGANVIVNQDIKGIGKMETFHIVMMYDRQENLLLVELKDVKAKILYKERIDEKLEKEELKKFCLNKIEVIGLEEGKIVFKKDLMSEISEKSDESDVGPLIEALEKDEDVVEQFISRHTSEHGHGDDALEIEEEVGILREEDGNKQEFSIIRFERMNTNESQGEVSTRKNADIELEHTDPRNLSLKNSNVQTNAGNQTQPERLNEYGWEGKEHPSYSKSSKSGRPSYPEIEEINSKSLLRTILFSKKFILKGNLVTLRVESQHIGQRKPKLLLTCYYGKSSGQFETIELPSSMADKKEMTLQDLLDVIVIEFDPFKLSLAQTSTKKDSKLGVQQDSFSSRTEPSIALDISGPHVEKEGPMSIFKAESLKKSRTIETGNELMLPKGFSTGLLEMNSFKAQNEKDEGLQGNRAQLLKDRKLTVDETNKNMSGFRVTEVSSGREQSFLDKDHSRRIRDSRNTISQGDFTHRSEAEGSIMLRVSEGVTLYCTVAYKKNETDVLIKYSMRNDDSEEWEEIKIPIKEIGLEPESASKDVLFEKVRAILGKRMKYRAGKLVYDKNERSSKPVSRQETLKVDSKNDLTSISENRLDKSSRRDKDEYFESSSRNAKSKEGSLLKIKSLRDSGIVAIGLKSQGTSEDSRTLSKKESQVVKDVEKEMKDVNSENRLRVSAIQNPRQDSFGRKKNAVKFLEDTEKVVSPVNLVSPKKSLVETFGALQSSRENSLTNTPRTHSSPSTIKKQPNSLEEALKASNNLALKISEEDLLDRRVKISNLKIFVSGGAPSSKFPPEKSLKPPELKKMNDSSPKVKSNSVLGEVNEVGIDGECESPSFWSAISANQHEVSANIHYEESKMDVSRASLSRQNSIQPITTGPKIIFGEIPRIVIHREQEAPITLNFNLNTKPTSLELESKSRSRSSTSKNESKISSLIIVENFENANETNHIKTTESSSGHQSGITNQLPVQVPSEKTLVRKSSVKLKPKYSHSGTLEIELSSKDSADRFEGKK